MVLTTVGRNQWDYNHNQSIYQTKNDEIYEDRNRGTIRPIRNSNHNPNRPLSTGDRFGFVKPPSNGLNAIRSGGLTATVSIDVVYCAQGTVARELRYPAPEQAFPP